MLLKLPIVPILCPLDFSFTGTAATLLHKITQMIHNIGRGMEIEKGGGAMDNVAAS